HTDVATSLNNLAELLRRQDPRDMRGEAEGLYREALAVQRKLLGDEDLDLGRTLENISLLLGSKGQQEEAEVTRREGLAIRRKLDPDAANSLANLAKLVEAQGKFSEAEALLRQALAIRVRIFGVRHRDVQIGTLTRLKDVLGKQGKPEEAAEVYREMVKIARKRWGSEHPDVAYALVQLGDLLNGQSMDVEAAAARSESVAPTSGPAREGRMGEAETAVRDALAILGKISR